MSDNTEQPPSLVAKLKRMAEGSRRHDGAMGTIGDTYYRAAEVTKEHESRWQSDRAALVARAEAAEKRLADLHSALQTVVEGLNKAVLVGWPKGGGQAYAAGYCDANAEASEAIGRAIVISQACDAIEKKGATDE